MPRRLPDPDHADMLAHAPGPARVLRVRARTLRAATRVVPHAHPWAQVAYSATGVVRLTAGDQTFLVPPTRAVWIPAGIEHAVTVVEDAEMRTLYLHQGSGVGPQALGGERGDRGDAAPGDAREAGDGRPAGSGDWHGCRVIAVSRLMRELVEQLVAAPPGERERHVAALVQDELSRARPLPLGLVLPADKRLRRLCEALLEDPARHARLDDWAADSGASPRTIARLFRSELGTTFAAWREQALLARAMTLAARGRPMAQIAAALGYASASAFGAMVKRSVGETPRRFLAGSMEPPRSLRSLPPVGALAADRQSRIRARP